MPALVLLAYLSLFSFSIIDNARGPFYPDILTALDLDGTRGSLFFAVVSFMSFAGAVTSPWILHRKSSLFLLNVGSLMLGLGFAAMGAAPNLYALLIFCAVLGWGYGTLNVAQSLVVGEASPVHARRRYLSGLHSMYAFAALLAPLAATLARAAGWDWRKTFVVLAVIPILLAVAGCFFKPQLHSEEIKAQKTLRLARADYVRCFWFILMLAGYLWAEISVSTRMVLWLRTAREFSADRADVYLAGFFLALALGRASFGVLHFKKAGNWRILLSCSLLTGVLLALGLRFSPVFAVLSGLTMGPFYPVCMEQILLSFPGKSAKAMAVIIGFGSFSVVLMHVTVGRLNDLIGIEAALYAGPIAVFAVALGLAWTQFKRGHA